MYLLSRISLEEHKSDSLSGFGFPWLLTSRDRGGTHRYGSPAGLRRLNWHRSLRRHRQPKEPPSVGVLAEAEAAVVSRVPFGVVVVVD